VTVACALSGRVNGVRYLAVSVARGPNGGLAVDAPPALFAAPPLAQVTAPAEESGVSGPEAAEIEALARDFLDAYLTGAEPSALERLLAPGARLVPARLEAAAVEVTDVIELGAPSPRLRSVGVDARVRSETGGATYPLRYRLDLVRTDRWYVRSIAGGSA